MIKLEKILGLVAVVSLILKLLLIPFSGTVLTISLLTLALIYYPLGFAFFNGIRLREILKKESYKGKSALRILGAIGVGMALSMLCVGILFKLQSWAYSNTNLSAGLFFTVIALIVVMIGLIKKKDDFHKTIFKRIIIFGGLGLFLLFIPELSIVKFQFRNHPDYIKAYEIYLQNPDNLESQEKLDYEFNKATMSEKEFNEYIKELKEK